MSDSPHHSQGANPSQSVKDTEQDKSNPRGSVLALTGTMGSGKSTAAAILADLGAVIISADTIAREVVAVGSPGLHEITQVFGREVLSSKGALDRKKLGEIVFSDREALEKLESITHPRIQQRANELFSAALEEKPALIVYDCPLLFEKKLHTLGFSASLLIAADRSICLDRVRRRDGLSVAEVEKRLNAQMSVEEKRELADYVIENNESVASLRAKLAQLFHELTRNKSSERS